MSEGIKLPEIPTQISRNGKEVWDWASKFSDAVHRADRIRMLKRKIALRECGDCALWMTKACPRERHDNAKGHSVGPSMKEIPCVLFLDAPDKAALRDEWRARLLAEEAES
jgi:hypothetical protein